MKTAKYSKVESVFMEQIQQEWAVPLLAVLKKKKFLPRVEECARIARERNT
jgi:hypothetical protein